MQHQVGGQPWIAGQISLHWLGNDSDLRFNGLQVCRVMLVKDRLIVKKEIVLKDIKWAIMLTLVCYIELY